LGAEAHRVVMADRDSSAFHMLCMAVDGWDGGRAGAAPRCLPLSRIAGLAGPPRSYSWSVPCVSHILGFLHRGFERMLRGVLAALGGENHAAGLVPRPGGQRHGEPG
jgi:hypothetical protein